MAEEFLSQEDVPFEVHDVSKDSKALAEMMELSGSRSVPVIAGCDEVITGFDKGKLTKMIECVKGGS